MAKKYIDAELIKSARVLYFDIDACITELIRARIEHNEENEGKALFRMEGLMVATMQQLDCIIDTLQQEQSCDTCTNDKGCVTCKDGELREGKEQPSEDLEEAADREARKVYPYEGGTKGMICETSIPIFKRGFIAGAEWQAERLLKGSPMPEDTVIFQKGIEEGKRLMMEDAVEGEVCKDHIVTEKPFYFYQSRLIELPDNLKEGDKVKIVIVKEDKE